MTATARLIRHHDVGVIELDNPPVNALALGLRIGLEASLEAALGDPSIVAIVLVGVGRMFCGGADLGEFNTPAAAQPPFTGELRTRMDRSAKPIVAALHGSVLGAGLEMALACHYRIAAAGTQLGLPEVRRGLLPGGGGTQRLPRLVGVPTALRMIVTGDTVDARGAKAIGLVDEVVGGVVDAVVGGVIACDVSEAAVAFARTAAARGGQHPVAATREVAVDDADTFFASERARVKAESHGLDAPLECLACVEAATRLPFDEGLAFERSRLRVLVEGTQSKALRHLFFAERAAATAPDVIASAMAFGGVTANLPVMVGNCDGFVGHRMLSVYIREADFLLEEGASPAQVDGALQRFGLAMGPFRTADLAGLDIGWAGRNRQAATRPKHLRYSRVADRICELGRFGQKTGAGWYRYGTGSRTPIPDPEVDRIIAKCAAEAGIARRTIADQEIVERTMYALANEGAKILAEGVMLRASDIDLVYVKSYGFPAYRGGPMYFADTIGLKEVAERVLQFHCRHGDWWTPAPLLLERAAASRGFNNDAHQPRASPGGADHCV